MTTNRQEIDDLKAEIQQSKQELASAGDVAQLDFHRKRLLQLENQLSSLREQQTVLLQSSQQHSSYPSMTSSNPHNHRQEDQQPMKKNFTDHAADQAIEALHPHGFAWLKVSTSEMCSFHQLQQYTNGPDSCFDQAGKLLKDKKLLQYNTGKPNSTLLSAVCTAANKVSAADLQCKYTVQPLDQP